MNWIFLSPHLDDAAYSCGGLIWELTSQGTEVSIWTVCSADPPDGPLSPLAESLHRDWGQPSHPYQVRREEDRQASRILGAEPRYLAYLDCIYRRASSGEPYYASEEAIFGGLDPREEGLVDELSAQLKAEIPPGAQLAAPLGIGNHVDHQLVRKAVSRLGRPCCYYADYPYAREPEGGEILGFMEAAEDWQAVIHPISGTGLQKWTEAALAYASQLNIFWEHQGALEAEIQGFSASQGGLRLWSTIEPD